MKLLQISADAAIKQIQLCKLNGCSQSKDVLLQCAFFMYTCAQQGLN